MSARQNLFEEFILQFENLRAVVKDNPKRLITFYNQSKEVSNAADAFRNFLLRTDFERRIFHGPRKLFLQAPSGFETAWQDYQTRWAATLNHIEIRELLNSFDGRHFSLDGDFDPEASAEALEPSVPDGNYPVDKALA